jgi:uncharacterized membrane protein
MARALHITSSDKQEKRKTHKNVLQPFFFFLFPFGLVVVVARWSSSSSCCSSHFLFLLLPVSSSSSSSYLLRPIGGPGVREKERRLTSSNFVARQSQMSVHMCGGHAGE